MIGLVSQWFRTYGFADVSDDLLVGAYPLDADDVRNLERLGVKRVLNLVEDQEYEPGERAQVVAALAEAGIEEHRLPLTDYGGLPAQALDAAAEDVIEALDAGLRSYVHCRAGWQRSAAVAVSRPPAPSARGPATLVGRARRPAAARRRLAASLTPRRGAVGH